MGAGRPASYDSRYCQEMIDYFSQPLFVKSGNKKEGNELPQFAGFALKIGVHRETLLNWCKQYPEFLDAYKHCQGLQEQIIAGNAILGRYNPYFAQFMLKNCHGWRDKTEVEQTVQEIKIDKQDEQL